MSWKNKTVGIQVDTMGLARQSETLEAHCEPHGKCIPAPGY